MTGREADSRHVPVLLEETLEGLSIRQGGVYLDGTIGLGGHSLQILQRFRNTRIIGIDRDPAALDAAAARLAQFDDRVVLKNRDFKQLGKILDEVGVRKVDGILMDLGVSSMQLEEARRGFSFALDGPLDMRMDRNSRITAADIINTWHREDLARLFFHYGEERRSRAIASAIVSEREEHPINSTRQLAELISAVRGMERVRNIHPATRTFQALRIEVNDELEAIKQAIPEGVTRLSPGGRMVIISFHSLEDRIVKRCFREMENPCTCPKEFPECMCGKTSTGKVLTKRPLVPSEKEIRENPRSRSAKLRVFERQNVEHGM